MDFNYSPTCERFRTQVQDFMTVEVLSSERAYSMFRQLLNYAPYKSEGVRLRCNSFGR